MFILYLNFLLNLLHTLILVYEVFRVFCKLYHVTQKQQQFSIFFFIDLNAIYFLSLADSFSTKLNRSRESGRSCLGPDLRENASMVSMSRMLAVALPVMA